MPDTRIKTTDGISRNTLHGPYRGRSVEYPRKLQSEGDGGPKNDNNHPRQEVDREIKKNNKMKHIMKSALYAVAAALTFLFAGCSNNSGYRRPDVNPDKPDDTFTFQINPDWTISHSQSVVTDDYGFQSDIDIIHVASLDQEYYWLDVIMESNLESWYNGDIIEYIKDEPNYYSSDSYRGSTDIEFDRMRSGKWVAVAIGITANGDLTGDYAYLKFTIAEDEAEPDFTKWLGDWTITGASSKEAGKDISYNLHITSSDNNYLVNVTGWEAGKSDPDDTDMSDYILEVQYDRFTKTLLFKSLYLETESIDNKDYDLCFYGNFIYDGSMGYTDLEKDGQYTVTDNIIIAESSKLSDEGNKATVDGLNFNFNHDNKIYNTKLISMQYFDLPLDANDENIYSKHSSIPVFPLTMTRAEASSSVSPASISPAKTLKVKTSRHESNAGRVSTSSSIRATR